MLAVSHPCLSLSERDWKLWGGASHEAIYEITFRLKVFNCTFIVQHKEVLTMSH